MEKAYHATYRVVLLHNRNIEAMLGLFFQEVCDGRANSTAANYTNVNMRWEYVSVLIRAVW